MYRKFFYILNLFGIHMIWIISVLSLMPKGEIVGIKLFLPLVTTLSNIIDSTELRSECSVYRVMQCLPGNAVSTGLCSVYRAMQCLPGSAVFTEYSSFCSVHRVQFRIQCSPSTVQNVVFTESPFRIQWLPRNSVYRVNFLYRVFSGYRVQNYSRWLVWTVSSLLPSAWRCRVM